RYPPPRPLRRDALRLHVRLPRLPPPGGREPRLLLLLLGGADAEGPLEPGHGTERAPRGVRPGQPVHRLGCRRVCAPPAARCVPRPQDRVLIRWRTSPTSTRPTTTTSS